MQHAFIISQFSPYIIGQKITYSVYFAVKKQNKTKHKTKQNAFSTNRKFFWVQIFILVLWSSNDQNLKKKNLKNSVKKFFLYTLWKFRCLNFFSFFLMFLLVSERNRFPKELCFVFISNDLYLFVHNNNLIRYSRCWSLREKTNNKNIKKNVIGRI